MIPAALLAAVAPRVFGPKADRQNAIIAEIGPILRKTLADWHIDTDLRIAHFVAQIAHESDGFTTTEEYASGDAYDTGRRAERLGNTPVEDDDGERYKGRGLIMLTGRDNYHRCGIALALPLVEHPEMAAEPVTSLRIACWYWDSRDCNGPADADDLIGVTRLVNGGTNGLADRRRYLARAKDALAMDAGIKAELDDMDGTSVLWRGCQGAEVATLQRLLRERGFMLAIDGDFGPATETAVRTWQARAGLKAAGICGAKTWASLTDSPADGRKPSPAPDSGGGLIAALARLWRWLWGRRSPR